jgi:hypothetical protein
MIQKIRPYLLIVGILALSACGRAPVRDVAPEFEGYVASFEQKAASVGSNVAVDDVIIKFGAVKNKRESGLCLISGDQTPRITINKANWDKMDEPEREALIFHELGHCVLRREHRESYTDQGIPESLMNPYTIEGRVYTYNESYYVKELFSKPADF